MLVIAILLLGVFARTWELDSLPPGLNQDEAALGVDAYYLLHYGVSFPVHLISFGSRQSALYAYLVIPVIALGGLSPFTIRLPILLSGILTMPLLYFVAKKTLGQTYALISMFLLAISPWHIMASRWGHEANFLLLFSKRVSLRDLVIGLLVLAVLVAPIACFCW